MPYTQENPLILTEQEADVLFCMKQNSEEVKRLMQEKGIEYNSGNIWVDVEGNTHQITTEESDFGTWILPKEQEEQ